MELQGHTFFFHFLFYTTRVVWVEEEALVFLLHHRVSHLDSLDGGSCGNRQLCVCFHKKKQRQIGVVYKEMDTNPSQLANSLQ